MNDCSFTFYFYFFSEPVFSDTSLPGLNIVRKFFQAIWNYKWSPFNFKEKLGGSEAAFIVMALFLLAS